MVSTENRISHHCIINWKLSLTNLYTSQEPHFKFLLCTNENISQSDILLILYYLFTDYSGKTLSALSIQKSIIFKPKSLGICHEICQWLDIEPGFLSYSLRSYLQQSIYHCTVCGGNTIREYPGQILGEYSGQILGEYPGQILGEYFN